MIKRFKTFLAPMDGYTDFYFRSLISKIGFIDAVFTPFVRISASRVTKKTMEKELGHQAVECPQILQFMMADTVHIKNTLDNIPKDRVTGVDCNFGCPARKAFGKIAGSGLLAYPEKMGDIVKEFVQNTDLPVSVKMRPGIENDALLRESLHAVCEAGASVVTMHGRLKTTTYKQKASWNYIAKTKTILNDLGYSSVPLIGNGSINNAQDAKNMMKETACDAVMIGQAAFSNPWIFKEISTGEATSKETVKSFILDYIKLIKLDLPANAVLGRVKQILCANDFKDKNLLQTKTVDDIERFLENG